MTTGAIRHPWRPIFWEPVAGTGERLMVGVIHAFGGAFGGQRTIRDDVLDGLFGKAAPGLRKLIDHGMSTYLTAAGAAQSLVPLGVSLGGLHPGPIRETEAHSPSDLLQIACLLYSSLSNLDRFDDAEESDAPSQEDVNKRFSTEVRDEVVRLRPDLAGGFGRAGALIDGGQKVRFGFLSPKAALHFSVLHPVRQSASIRDARARLFELQRVRELSGISTTALIAAVPRDDDPTLGRAQRERLADNKREIEREADAVQMRWFPVHTADSGAEKVLEIIG